jgi:hypothetical protein
MRSRSGRDSAVRRVREIGSHASRSEVGDTTVVDLLVGQPPVGDVDNVARRADISLAIPLARTRPKQWRATANHHRREVYTELVHGAPLERLSEGPLGPRRLRQLVDPARQPIGLAGHDLRVAEAAGQQGRALD